MDADHLLGTCACGSMSKEQAQPVLASSSAADYKNFDSFLQDASSDAIEKLLTDRLSAGAEMSDRPPGNHGILFSNTKSVAASLPATQHSRFSWFSCCFRVVHLVMQGKDAD